MAHPTLIAPPMNRFIRLPLRLPAASAFIAA